MSFAVALLEAATASGVALSPRVVEACRAHYELLVTWNRTHNLTRIVSEDDAARLHYLDCLIPLLAWEPPRSFVDIGSGAGFPGLLAALAWPDAEAILVEPAKKRASFLTLAANAMGLALGSTKVMSPGDQPRAERVLSRATFPPGGRRELAGYALEHGQIAVWGHRHDLSTWETELATWGFRSLPPRDYRVDGVEQRCLLLGTTRIAP